MTTEADDPKTTMDDAEFARFEEYGIVGMRVEKEFENMKSSFLYRAAEKETGQTGFKSRHEAIRAITKARVERP